jgi:hypothetical protein
VALDFENLHNIVISITKGQALNLILAANAKNNLDPPE